MNWIEIHITCTPDAAEKVSEQLEQLGALAVTFKDAADQPIYEPKPGEKPRLWQDTIATGLFDENQSLHELIHSFEIQQAEGLIKSFYIAPLADQDWVRLNLDTFHPLLIGKRLCICPSWIKPPDAGRNTVILDPGLAFGTGTHPTTALCLEWLEQHIMGNEYVIDYGCGSGILSLAALKLGAKHVAAIDYDGQALTATEANAEKNNISHTQLETTLPNNFSAKPADLLIANILAQPIIQLANHFATLIKPDGRILLSGILNSQAADIITIYQKWFTLSPPVSKEGWALITGKKSFAQ